MLSRTASELYWLSRYLERAENTARMLDVAWNMSMIPFVTDSREEITAPLVITGSQDLYGELHGDVDINRVLHFFALDEQHSGSIYHCLRMARENAHAVRGRITAEMWESINSTWLELKDMQRQGINGVGATGFFEWVKNRSHLFRGATYGTIMRNDAFRFLRVGTFIERADNTARILDVRHQAGQVAGNTSVDYYRWNALLRSVGAYEAYREIYRQGINADHVAELLILSAQVPRSLRACVEALALLLPQIEGSAGVNAKRLVTVQFARLQYGDLDYILEIGLHEYLTDFLRRINELADTIRREYLEVV
jgi:uncharacterized alpha-E superfamily protein